jgi:tetratricopeptide (TPR) repeat protein
VKQLVCRPKKQQQNNDSVVLVDWFLTMEFETVPQTTEDDNDDDDDEDDGDNEISLFQPGDYVELKELVAAPKYNGQYGVIISDNEFCRTDRYTVQVRCSVNKHKTKLLTIRPKNLTRFITLEDYSDDTSNTIVDSINISGNSSVASMKSEWTWKFHRVQPNTGGTLEGTAEDCASLISFEWLDASQPLHENSTYKLDQLEAMEFRSKYEMLYECKQQFGTSGYYLNTSRNQRSRLGNGGLETYYFVRVDGNNRIENTSQQFKLCPIESLPRDDTMPLPPKGMWPRADLDDEGPEENWVISIFNRVAVEGSFVVEWSDRITNSKGEKKLKYSFYVDSLGPKEPPLRKSYAMVSFVYGQENEVVINNLDNSPFMGNDVSSRSGTFGILNGGKGHPFMKFFTENQSQYFCARLWHWVLRQTNVMSLMKHTDTQMALSALLVLYTNNKSRKDALNAAIMKADYSYQIKGEFVDGNERVYHASLKVGNILEALDRFSDAGDVYAETGDVYAETGDVYAETGDTVLYMSYKTYIFAGTAFKKAGNFIEAERHFVKALHCNRIANNPNGKHQAFLFEELVEIYYNTNREEGDEVVMGALLPTLLCVAGFDSYQGKDMPFIKTIGAYDGILWEKFDSRSSSRNVLEKAMQFSTVDDFRDVLLACKNPKVDLRRAAKDHSMYDSYFAERRKRDKKIAKQVLGAGCVVVPPDQTCDNCTASMLSPKQCPCETVLYCSKSCQLSHWKTHKQVCPFRAKKTDSE